MTLDDYNSLFNAGTLITVLDKNGNDITNQATITNTCNETSTTCSIKVRYNGIEKTETIIIK